MRTTLDRSREVKRMEVAMVVTRLVGIGMLVALNACVAQAPPPPAVPETARILAAAQVTVFVDAVAPVEGSDAGRFQSWTGAIPLEVAKRFKEVGFQVTGSPETAEMRARVVVSKVEAAMIRSSLVRVSARLELSRGGQAVASANRTLGPGELEATTPEGVPQLLAQHLVYGLATDPALVALANSRSRARAEPTTAAAAPPPARPNSPPAPPSGIVILKDGNEIHGRIVAQSPGAWVTIQEGDRLRTFRWERVDEVIDDHAQ